jgi:3-demethylubiquinone-9 3-methyltransferase
VGGPAKEGTVIKASFTVAGQSVMYTDSFVHHEFSFTPSSSFFVICDSEGEIRRMAQTLAEGGAYAVKQLRLQHAVRMGQRSFRGFLAAETRLAANCRRRLTTAESAVGESIDEPAGLRIVYQSLLLTGMAEIFGGSLADKLAFMTTDRTLHNRRHSLGGDFAGFQRRLHIPILPVICG